MMKRYTRHFILNLILMSLPVSAASEERLPRPDQFFEQHFSESLLQADRDLLESTRGSKSQNDSKLSDGDSSGFRTADEVEAPAHAPESQEAYDMPIQHSDTELEPNTTDLITSEELLGELDSDALIHDKGEDLDISHISIVVSTTPKSHLYEVFNSYVQSLEYYNIKPASLFLIGHIDFNLDFPSSWMRLIAQGVQVNTEYSVLEQLGISSSPTWILHSSEGDILIEGDLSIEQYLTSTGKFRRALLESQKSKQQQRGRRTSR